MVFPEYDSVIFSELEIPCELLSVYGEELQRPVVCPHCKSITNKISRHGKDNKYKCTKCRRMFTEKMAKSPMVPQLNDYEIRRIQNCK